MQILKPFSEYLVSKLIDWLIILFIATLILWAAFTLPVFSSKSHITDLSKGTETRLKSTVSTLINTYNPRTYRYETLDFTTDFLRSELAQLGTVEVQPFGDIENREKIHKNLILRLGPNTKEVYVIGAHYDTEDESLDAEGNASGVATLLELARKLAKYQDKLAIGVQLVVYPISKVDTKNLFTSVKTIGSEVHAKSLKRSGTKVRMMLSLDSVGHFNSESGSQKYPYGFLHAFYPSQGDYISVVGGLGEYQSLIDLKKSFVRSTPLPIVSFNLLDHFVPTGAKDHLHYQEQGYPSLLITDTAKFRKQDEKKSVVETLDYKRMGLLVKGLYQVVMDNYSESVDPIHMAER